MIIRHTLAGLVLASAALATGVARAEDDPIDDGLRRIRTHVEAERWKAGRDAIIELLDAHPGERRLLGELPSLEASLQTCIFNMEFEPPHGAHLFGPMVRELDHRKREIEIVSQYADEKHGWVVTSNGISLFPLALEGEVEVTCKGTTGAGAILCWSVDGTGGYELITGYYKEEYASYLTLDRMIRRIDDDGRKELHRKPTSKPWSANTEFSFRRKGSSLEIRAAGKRLGKASDGTFKSGLVGVFDLAEPPEDAELAYADRVHDIVIKGTVEEGEYDRALASYRTESFRDWVANTYRREDVLPAWVLDPDIVRSTADVPLDLPSDGPQPSSADGKRLARIVEAYLGGRYDDVLRESADLGSLRTRTRRYVEGLAAMARGEDLVAFEIFEWLAENEPHFGPGRVFYAQCLLGAYRIEDARAQLEKAEAKCPDFPALLETRALLALWEGDPEAAEEVLKDAAARGIDTAGIGAVREFLSRRRNGPRWAQRYSHQTRHFDVASDLSEDLCQEVGKLLEASLTAYSTDFARLIRKDRARVYVFSGREGYLAYASGIGSDLEGSAGAYMPALGQLVVWVPTDRERLWKTVKHEGFHQFLDNFVDGAPLWFNEGHAEYYEIAGYEAGFLRTHAINAEHRDLLRAKLGSLPRVKHLMRMGGGEFMQNAEMHYPMSWALVHFLRKPPDRRYAGLLDAYFEKLKEGATRDEAFDAVFKDVADDLDRDFREYIRKME